MVYLKTKQKNQLFWLVKMDKNLGIQKKKNQKIAQFLNKNIINK